MALFSKKNINHKYSDPLYAYFEALENKGFESFDIEDPIDKEYIKGAIEIIEVFDKGQALFQWYKSSSEIYFLERKLMDNRVYADSIRKNKSYYDFWTEVHRTLIMTYLADKKNYLDIAVV